MASDAIDDLYWFAGDGDGDGELRCALESFCGRPPPQAAAFGYGDARCGVEAEQACSRKRSREEPCAGSKSKACREKIRRDKLNERFLELSLIIDPSRPPRTDKVGVLGDAARVLVELRNEVQKLKESNEKLQEAIKNLKAEKNEIRDEKMRLKADKERLEQQIKAMSAVPPASFMPHPIAFHTIASTAPFIPPNQAPGSKPGHFAAYPAMGMWPWLPPAIRDTTQDSKLWPPSA